MEAVVRGVTYGRVCGFAAVLAVVVATGVLSALAPVHVGGQSAAGGVLLPGDTGNDCTRMVADSGRL